VQRRKTLRAALSGSAGSAVRAEECPRAAGVDPKNAGRPARHRGVRGVSPCPRRAALRL